MNRNYNFVIRKIVTFLIREILLILSKSWRINIVGDLPDKPSVIAFWHGEMLPVWAFFSKYTPTAVVSLSKDGEILASFLTRLNYSLLRGSSSKKSSEVLNSMVVAARKNIVLVTPDGPRGPRFKFKAGAVIAAQRAEAPLVLLRCSTKNKKIFNKSWDKFEIPLPFSKIIINIIDIYNIKHDYDREKISQILLEIEKKMNKI